MKLSFPTSCKRFLRSPRIIIAELAGLALAGVLGAALPQAGTASAVDLARLSENGPLFKSLVDVLALDHVFRSPWFLALTVLAAASLAIIVVEQIRRLRRSWSQVLTESHFRDAPYRAEFERPKGAHPSPVRGAMSIVTVPQRGQAPSGAACLTQETERNHLPLLTELELSLVGPGFYRHGAPDGALAPALNGEMSGPEACRAPTPVARFWTENKLALAGSPIFHAGLLLVMLAGALRALFGVDAAVDVLEGETLAPTTRDWAAQWPGLLAKPFKFDVPVTLESLDVKRYEGGDLRELNARLAVQANPGTRRIDLAVNRDAHAAGGRIFLTTEFGPAALLEWRGKEGTIIRQAALLSEQGRGTFEGSASGPGGLVAHLRAQVDKEGRHPSIIEVRLMREGGLLLAADARPGEALSFAGGELLTLRGVPFWARLRGSRDSALGLAYAGFAMVMIGVTLLFTLIKVDGFLVVIPAGDQERVFLALKPQRFVPLFRERFEKLVREEGGLCPGSPSLSQRRADIPVRPAIEIGPADKNVRAPHSLATSSALLLALCLALTACRPSSREQARQLVARYNQVVAEAYRRGDVKLIDPVVGPNEGRKLTGLIGVRLDMGLTLDSQLLSLEVTRVEQEREEMRVWTSERWRYCDRRIGTGQQVGEDSLDAYQILYVFKKLDRNWLVDEIRFNAPPQVGRKQTPWPTGHATPQADRPRPAAQLSSLTSAALSCARRLSLFTHHSSLVTSPT